MNRSDKKRKANKRNSKETVGCMFSYSLASIFLLMGNLKPNLLVVQIFPPKWKARGNRYLPRSSTNNSSSGDDSGSQVDEPCAICGDDEALGKNAMIFCDGPGCDVPVHIKCYKVSEVPPGDNKWFCHRCEDKVPVGETDIICCSTKSGALKRTNYTKKYIHVPCAWFNNSVEAYKDDEYFTVEKWLIGSQVF